MRRRRGRRGRGRPPTRARALNPLQRRHLARFRGGVAGQGASDPPLVIDGLHLVRIGRPRDNPKQRSRVGGGRLCTVEEFDDLMRTPGLAGDRLRESVREPIGTPVDVRQPRAVRAPRLADRAPCEVGGIPNEQPARGELRDIPVEGVRNGLPDARQRPRMVDRGRSARARGEQQGQAIRSQRWGLGGEPQQHR